MSSECPIVEQAELVSGIAKSLLSQLRKLRYLERRCKTCPKRDTCDQRTYWSQHIDAAITAVAQDWGLI